MKQYRRFPLLIEVVALFGLLFYLAQSWHYAHSLDSIGDEGAYLYKGFMFAKGEYRPFQEYAFWTNKAPLAFLIPGYIQLWFGPGLQEARYFSVFVGALMLVGIWVTARRLGGRAWGAAAVWIFALTSPQIVIYSEAVSQVLIACMMAWMFALTLGEDRSLWQLVLGSALSVLIVMTRQNIVVVPVFLVLYIFWQHGRKAGLWSLATTAVLFIGFHLYYWPNILQLWAPWLPDSLTPFLDRFRLPMNYERTYAIYKSTPYSILKSFSTGMGDNFFVFFGSLSALALFPKRDRWRSDSRFKMAVFLGVTFLVLFVMHTMASLFIPYCVYCFSGYQMFYTTAGFFFVLVVLLNGINDLPSYRVWLLLVVLLFFAAILGLYHQPAWSDWLLSHVRLLRINELFAHGRWSTVSFWDALVSSLHIAPAAQKRLSPMITGIFLGTAFWIVLWFLYRFLAKRTWMQNSTFAATILFCSLFLGLILSFGKSMQSFGNRKCSANYLTYYERAGRSLAETIPPGSLLYWRGSGKQLALMLYLQDVRIFPPQVQAGGGYVVGDTQQLPKFGMYNKELDTQWRAAADILAIWEDRMSPEVLKYLQQQHYEEIPYDMGELSQCEDVLYVFRRTQ